MSPGSTTSNERVILSRRQRKNRKKRPRVLIYPTIVMGTNEKTTPKLCKDETNRPVKDESGRTNFICLDDIQPLDEFMKMTIPEDMLVRTLKQQYALSKEDMAMLGYPLRPDIFITKPLSYCNYYPRKQRILDVYAKEFVPKYKSGYSEICSSSSSEEDISSGSEGNMPKQLYYFYFAHYPFKQYNLNVHAEEFVPSESGSSDNGYSSSSEEDSSSDSEDYDHSSFRKALSRRNRKDVRTLTCTRCGSFFCTTSKKYLTKHKCSYHPGRLETTNSEFGPMIYSCCGKSNGSLGCESAKVHVWAGPKEPIVNSSFVETDPPKHSKGGFKIYSLDCEMSYTVAGLEVVKITVVDISGKPVYNQYVKPVNKIVDYNTRFSGICEEDFLKYPTKSLAEVQQDLKTFICSETVLVGHGLENDLKGLKLIHKTVVDTAFSFPHVKGLPYKRSLKSLVHICLNREIQNGSQGHDSFEDARATMELMLFRLRKDFPYNF